MYLGVDFASVDGNKPVDWAAVKAAGTRFVIIRGAYNEWADPTYKAEAKRAREAGLLVGSYLFPLMRDTTSPDGQVMVFSDSVKLTPGDLPPVLDVEFPGGLAKTGMTRVQALEWVRRAVRAMERCCGVKPMIYTSARVWDGTDADSLSAKPTPDLIECPLWLARYPYNYRQPAVGDDPSERSTVISIPKPPVPKSWGVDNVWIHQYQGDAIGFRGFSSTVDVNRFFDLAMGRSGERVKWVQRRVGIHPSGVFDACTDSHVRAFQAANRLQVDGVVGPVTFASLAWVSPGAA